MPNKPKKPGKRIRVRSPEKTKAFADRLSQAISASGLTQKEFGERLGGYLKETFSKIITGVSTQMPIDLVVSLGVWAVDAGISLRWLFAGLEAIDEKPATTMSQIESAAVINNAISYSMLMAIAARIGIELEPIVEKWTLEMPFEKGTYVVPVKKLWQAIDLEMADKIKAPKIEPGYRTIPACDLPSSPTWHEQYVPVIGRVAAGSGEETLEATEYPPAWAGEFVEFHGGSPTAIAVRVSGESMEPTYRQDDMLIVDTGRRAQPGQVCCVLIEVDGFREARVKKLLTAGHMVILASENPAWPPEKIPADYVVATYPIIAHLPRLAG